MKDLTSRNSPNPTPLPRPCDFNPLRHLSVQLRHMELIPIALPVDCRSINVLIARSNSALFQHENQAARPLDFIYSGKPSNFSDSTPCSYQLARSAQKILSSGTMLTASFKLPAGTTSASSVKEA